MPNKELILKDQKIIKIGTSHGNTIPKIIKEYHELKKGMKATIQQQPDGYRVYINKIKTPQNKEHERQIIKPSTNTYAVTIPKPIVNNLEIKKRMKCSITLKPDGYKVTINARREGDGDT
ncbi:MAG: hypothetical protein EF811_03910 [Methanonatronarchaeia archaeon]|nr:MAG: hypothetical protein EF811_03910 [Methanonatronarchaeia archaeon]